MSDRKQGIMYMTAMKELCQKSLYESSLRDE